MASIKRIDGRLQNEKGEWVWNGESYEFVQSHSDWLPLTFQSQSDAAKFKKLENIYNAEQIIKNSKNPQEVLAAKQWLSRQGVKHDDMSDTMAYTYLYHSGKGKERAGHKYSFREWTGNGWRYFYDDVLGYGHKKKAEKALNNVVDTMDKAKNLEKDINELKNNYNKSAMNKEQAEKELKYARMKYNANDNVLKDYSKELYDDGRIDELTDMFLNNPHVLPKIERSMKLEKNVEEASKKRDNANSQYRAAKSAVDQSLIRWHTYDIILKNNTDIYNKETKAYDKSIASKIDKGLKLINKLFKKNK